MDIFDDPQYAEERNASSDLIVRLTNNYLSRTFPSSRMTGSLTPIIVRNPLMNLSDVDYHMTVLRNQLYYLRDNGLSSFPAMRLSGGDIIPVNIFSGADFYADMSLKRDLDIDNAMQTFRTDFNDRKRESARYRSFENVGINEIRNAIRNTLASFLAFRLKGLIDISNSATMKKYLAKGKLALTQQNAPPYMLNGNTSRSKYLTITVKTPQHHGLTIASTPNYIENWTYFGAPSHPVTGYLEPGRYRFRADGRAVGGVRTHPLPIAIPPNFDIELDL